MGILGFGLLLGVLAAAARCTWRRARETHSGSEANPSLPLWLLAWTVVTSACFGVVLEGPMGAIVFWTSLGLANAESAVQQLNEPETSPPPAREEELAVPA
jgi:hypothetical protein